MTTQMTCLVFLSDLQVHDLMSQILIFLCSGKHTLKTGQDTPIFQSKYGAKVNCTYLYFSRGLGKGQLSTKVYFFFPLSSAHSLEISCDLDTCTARLGLLSTANADFLNHGKGD